nr:hypothetical protein [Tanacetum cinerariifolium]
MIIWRGCLQSFCFLGVLAILYIFLIKSSAIYSTITSFPFLLVTIGLAVGPTLLPVEITVAGGPAVGMKPLPCKLLTVASLIFWQWEQPSLAVETYTARQNENVVEEVVDAAQVSTAATTVTITTKEITLAQAIKALKTSKPKVKGIVFQEPELVEGKEKRAGEELVQEITKKQKVEDDKEKAELKQVMETIPNEEEVAIDAIPLAVKSSRIVDWKIHKKGKKSYYQIVRVDGKS